MISKMMNTEPVEIIKPLTAQEIGKNLYTIFLDWKKGKPYKGSGQGPFAALFDRTQRQFQKYFEGEVDIPQSVLIRLREMGYNTEWVLHRTGKMKSDQKASMGFTATVLLNTNIENKEQRIKRADARIKWLEKEVEELKKEVADLKALILRKL